MIVRALTTAKRLLSVVARPDGLSILDQITPRAGYELHADCAYGAQPRQLADLYIPREPRLDAPGVVFVHGGRWSFGDKSSYRFVGQGLASEGIATAVINYRLWPQACFPTFVEDAALAVSWLQTRSEVSFPSRLVLVGHSAGAQIAALLAGAGPWLADAGGSRERLEGLLALSGPYDFLPLRGDLAEIFGPATGHEASQPIRWVDGKEPPSLFLHGGRDRSVAPRNSVHMARRINEAGGSARVIVYPNLDHTRILGAFSARVGSWLGPVRSDMLAFLRTSGPVKQVPTRSAEAGG